LWERGWGEGLLILLLQLFLLLLLLLLLLLFGFPSVAARAAGKIRRTTHMDVRVFLQDKDVL